MSISIAVFTSARSEYGILKILLKEIARDPEFELRLLVGGTHLNQSMGYTINEIVADGFSPDATFDFLELGGELELAKSMGKLQVQLGNYFAEKKADFLLLLGDRFELLSVASIALVFNIPIIHFSGGDVTEGAIDNQIRNALTKISHIHLPANPTSTQNVVAMREESWRVCCVGELSLDSLKRLQLLNRADLFRSLRLDLTRPVVCATFHPETIDNQIVPSFVKSVCEMLLRRGLQVVTTGANADLGGGEINKLLSELADQNADIKYFPSLGQLRYFSLLKYSDLVIGNSSSGLIESHFFSIPTLNIGNRQKGRVSNLNVIDVPAEITKIDEAVQVALSKDFRNKFVGTLNNYGDGEATARAIAFIKSLLSRNDLLVKKG